jgi:hypothetical protein
MAFTPITDLIAMVINELSQVPGVVTQKYSSPVILQYLQNAYMLEIEEVWWPDYMGYFSSDIDPLTGRLTNDLVGPISGINDYGDVQNVWPVNSNVPLAALPDTINPNTFQSSAQTASAGSSPVYILPDYSLPNRPFRVLPTTAIGPIQVRARQRTAFPFSNSTTVGIDPLLLMFDAAWQYCVTDGTLPSQVAKYELMIRKRRQQAIARFNSQPIPLDSRLPTDILTVDQSSSFFIPVTI